MPRRKEVIFIEGVEHKKCTACGEIKPTTDFFKKGKYLDGSTQYKSNCMSCLNKKSLEHHYKNRRDNGIARQSAYRYTLRTAYGLSQEDFENLLAKQDGKCSICGTSLRNPFKDFSGAKQAVDHCHENGKVRAILCGTCNSGLGHFKDNPEILEKAIKYLNDHKGS